MEKRDKKGRILRRTIELRHRFIFIVLVFGHTQHLQAASEVCALGFFRPAQALEAAQKRQETPSI